MELWSPSGGKAGLHPPFLPPCCRDRPLLMGKPRLPSIADGQRERERGRAGFADILPWSISVVTSHPLHHHLIMATTNTVPVTFTYRSTSASKVEVSGDWDQWANRVELSKVAGVQEDGQDLWQATKQLPAQTKIAYKYILNGDDWHAREDLPTEQDAQGNKVSSGRQVVRCEPVYSRSSRRAEQLHHHA